MVVGWVVLAVGFLPLVRIERWEKGVGRGKVSLNFGGVDSINFRVVQCVSIYLGSSDDKGIVAAKRQCAGQIN